MATELFGQVGGDVNAQTDGNAPREVSGDPAGGLAVRVRGLTRRFDERVIVDRLDLDIRRGEFVALLGASGCGKSTLLRILADLDHDIEGDVLVSPRRAVAFQAPRLFPWKRVWRNVVMGLPGRHDRARADDALREVGLSHRGDAWPKDLSGGEAQRAALARALVRKPDLLLLDEPFGALDKKLRESMQVEMRQLQQRLGITTLMVTHDQDEAMTLSDRIAIMNNGVIEQIGSPREIYENPATRFVAGFIGTSNFFEGTVTRRERGGFLVAAADGVTLALDGVPPADGRATVALRPEAVRITTGDAAAPGPNQAATVVEQVVYHGVNTHYYLRRPGAEPLIAVRQNDDGHDTIEPGTAVIASWEAFRNRLVRDVAA